MKIGYEEANLSIFVDNRILYMKILLGKLLEVISELNKLTNQCTDINLCSLQYK